METIDLSTPPESPARDDLGTDDVLGLFGSSEAYGGGERDGAPSLPSRCEEIFSEDEEPETQEDPAAASSTLGGAPETVDLASDDDDECMIIEPPAKDSPAAAAGAAGTTGDDDESSDGEIEYLGRSGLNHGDYPHAREHCLEFAWAEGKHQQFCANCYCYVCEVPSSKCSEWSAHCHASSGSPRWKEIRRVKHGRLPSPTRAPAAAAASSSSDVQWLGSHRRAGFALPAVSRPGASDTVEVTGVSIMGLGAIALEDVPAKAQVLLHAYHCRAASCSDDCVQNKKILERLRAFHAQCRRAAPAPPATTCTRPSASPSLVGLLPPFQLCASLRAAKTPPHPQSPQVGTSLALPFLHSPAIHLYRRPASPSPSGDRFPNPPCPPPLAPCAPRAPHYTCAAPLHTPPLALSPSLSPHPAPPSRSVQELRVAAAARRARLQLQALHAVARPSGRATAARLPPQRAPQSRRRARHRFRPRLAAGGDGWGGGRPDAAAGRHGPARQHSRTRRRRRVARPVLPAAAAAQVQRPDRARRGSQGDDPAARPLVQGTGMPHVHQIALQGSGTDGHGAPHLGHQQRAAPRQAAVPRKSPLTCCSC